MIRIGPGEGGGHKEDGGRDRDIDGGAAGRAQTIRPSHTG